MKEENNRGGRPKVYRTDTEKRAAIRANNKRWREKNLEVERGKARERQRRRKIEHPEKVKASIKAWRERNPEKHLEIMRRAGRKRIAKWRAANPEASRREAQEWRRKNYTKFLALSRGYKAKRRAKQNGAFTQVDIDFLWDNQKGRCAFCLDPMVKSKFHIDHYQPISKGGSSDRGNLRLLHPKCNLEKSASDPLDHARKHGMLCW